MRFKEYKFYGVISGMTYSNSGYVTVRATNEDQAREYAIEKICKGALVGRSQITKLELVSVRSI